MDVKTSFKIGYVSKTHGLKGEVTIVMTPECPDLHSVQNIFLEINGHLVPHFIDTLSANGGKAFIRFEGVDTIEKATLLKGASMYLPKKERAVLPRGEFYNDEVIGFEVHDENGPLGKVIDLEEAGPNRFLVMDYNGREILVPVNGPFIRSINKSKKRITVELPDGFLDI